MWLVSSSLQFDTHINDILQDQSYRNANETVLLQYGRLGLFLNDIMA